MLLADGLAPSEKSCFPCDVIMKEFGEEHDNRGTPGYLRELLQDCIDNEGEEKMAAKLNGKEQRPDG